MIELEDSLDKHSNENLILILQGVKLSYEVFNGKIENEKCLNIEVSETREDFKVTLNYIFAEKNDREPNPQYQRDTVYSKDTKKIKVSKSETLKKLICEFESELNEIGNLEYKYL